jgi:predicted transposase/invertase (TIGR01784 family)
MEVRQMFATKLKEYEETLLTKGKIEGKIEAARRMLARGLDVTCIMDVTGLSQDEIETLRNQ